MGGEYVSKGWVHHEEGQEIECRSEVGQGTEMRVKLKKILKNSQKVTLRSQ